MIGWGSKPTQDAQPVESAGFDSFELRLGDVMRGERATLGKSLLDVQRELKIRAAYIAAIENSDPTAFDTPGFIAGYVRSYARYLGMDPDWAFRTFCQESGFETAHGMSEAASSPPKGPVNVAAEGGDLFASTTPFLPEKDPFFASVEPRAVGSVLVLAALVAGLGYGGWAVLQEVQRVQFAPVEQTPVIASDIDPLAGAHAEIADATAAAPKAEAFDRLYRPQALDVPILTARDAPISTLDPRSVGTLVTPEPELADAVRIVQAVAEAASAPIATPPVQVTEDPSPVVTLLAVRPSWVRVRGADGSVIFEKTLNAGEEYALPVTEMSPTLRAGNAGSLFFKVNGQVYGPAGAGTSVAKNVAISVQDVQEKYQLADLEADQALAEIVNVAQAQTTP